MSVEQAEREEKKRKGGLRVRKVLIEPLEADGMKRHPRIKADKHNRFLEKLVARLGYLSDDELRTMRRLVAASAQGRARNIWPGWVTIWNIAIRLREPPETESTIAWSWLHSRAGVATRGRGELVETYAFLRDKKRPPTKYDHVLIAQQAEENRSAVRRIEAAVSSGRASEADAAWLDWYQRTLVQCEEIVRAGEAHRQGQVAC